MAKRTKVKSPVLAERARALASTLERDPVTHRFLPRAKPAGDPPPPAPDPKPAGGPADPGPFDRPRGIRRWTHRTSK